MVAQASACVAFPIVLLVAPAAAQKKPVTLDTLNEIARERRSFAATWSPDGKSFVYKEDNKIYLFDCATRKSKELISTDAIEAAAVKPSPDNRPFEWENRNAEEGGLEWASNGKELLYTTGGDLFLIHVDSGKWDQLTRTPEIEHDPKLAPDSKSVAFRRGFDLYTLDLASHKETRLTTDGAPTLVNGGPDWVYPEELELGTAFWWSPDSRSIAYLQFDIGREPLYPHEDLLHLRAIYEPQHYPQAGENNAQIHFGVVSASGGATRWLDAGETQDSWLIARAGWMPDSKNVYVVRMNRIQNQLEMFSIGVDSGAREQIFQESDPYWINLSGDAAFLPDGKHFLWTSERDGGLRQIFLYSDDGKEVKRLTNETNEVKAITGYNQERVFFTSGDPLETHLFSVKLDGSGRRQIDEDSGTHRISMGPAGLYYLDTYSALASPPRTTLHSGGGASLSVVRESPDWKRKDEYDISIPEIVRFKGADGTELHGELIKPIGFQPGKKYPAIVLVYGGPAVDLPVHDVWSGISLEQVFASKGFVVWQAENRGGSGRGHLFEVPIFHRLGEIELADQVAGVKHLVSLGFVDPGKIGIRGWSYGGFMTLNALLNAPDVFKCGMAGAPVTDFRNYDTIYTERYMGLPSEDADGYAKTALASKAKNLNARLMIAHNFEDDNVLFQNTLQMIAALEAAGKQFELALYPQKTHGVTGQYTSELNAATVDFFERNLQ
jgi:dipeptidyl-peptidase 4